MSEQDEKLFQIMAEARRSGTCAYRMQVGENGIVETVVIPATEFWLIGEPTVDIRDWPTNDE